MLTPSDGVFPFMRTQLRIDASQWPEVWQAACRILEGQIPQTQLLSWVYPLRFLDVVPEVGAQGPTGRVMVRLAAKHSFSADWVRDHHQRAIEEALAQVLGSAVVAELTVEEGGSAPIEEAALASENEPATHREPAPAPQPTSQVQYGRSGSMASDQPDPQYTFANFVVGASNQFAHAAAVAVAEQPGKQYIPLFLYSPPGLGKTHLLHAIGNHILARDPQARVAYLSAEKFVNELIESLPAKRMPQFRKKYRESFDVLLIDDIHFIAGKTASEEEFFHTFNELRQTRRQIVLTSDRPPKEIERLEERIRTRFEWGLIADITPPEIETRIAILRTKAEKDDIYLPDDVATFLASYIKGNVRELEGILVRLQAQASLTGAEITLEMAKQELRTAIPEESAHFTVEAIQGAVVKHFQIKVADLRANSRTRQVVIPRQIGMFLVRKYTGIGLKEIGAYFGGRDHATVVHACKKIESDVESDPKTRQDVEAIQNLL